MKSKSIFYRLYQQSIKNSTSPAKVSQSTEDSPASPLEKRRISTYFRPSSPQFQPVVAEIDLQELTDVSIQEQSTIEIIRKQVNSRFSVQPEEPPDGADIVRRTKDWAAKRSQRLEEMRKEVSGRELEGCTFRPFIKALRSTSPSPSRFSLRSPRLAGQKSYVELYRDKLIYRALSKAQSSVNL